MSSHAGRPGGAHRDSANDDPIMGSNAGPHAEGPPSLKTARPRRFSMLLISRRLGPFSFDYAGRFTRIVIGQLKYLKYLEVAA